jgi:hypothetical protein
MLLTSELVTRAVRQRHPILGETVKLRVWMAVDIVRVELQAASAGLFRPQGAGPHYDQVLLDRLADRWAIESGEDLGRAWFEIDQRPQKTTEHQERDRLHSPASEALAARNRAWRTRLLSRRIRHKSNVKLCLGTRDRSRVLRLAAIATNKSR